MATIEAPYTAGEKTRIQVPTLSRPPRTTLRCLIRVEQDDDGGVVAEAIHLPGVVSEGATINEALANVVEAFAGAIEAYSAASEAIPWVGLDEPIAPSDDVRMVEVHV